MSKVHTIKLECKSCSHEMDFTVWDSVNVSLDPDMKEKVLNGEIFNIKCPNCGKSHFIDYPTLYHDMDKQCMIYYLRDNESIKQIYNLYLDRNKNNSFFNTLKHTTIRIVTSPLELEEKILIFDNNLDDRLIELSKLIIYYNYESKLPKIKNLNIVFNPRYTPHRFDFLDGYNPVCYADMPKNLYNNLVKDDLKNLVPIYDDNPIINKNWALEYATNYSKKGN